jgi:hypothetical protein
MSYANIYHSPWHNPGLILVANGLLLFFLLRQKVDTDERRYFRGFLSFLALLAIADAVLTGELTPIPRPIVTYVGIPFIILGDVRFFFLFERYAQSAGQTRSTGRLFLRSLAWGLIVPSTAYATNQLFFSERTIDWLFLTYETYFVILTLIYGGILLPKWLRSWNVPDDRKRWIGGFTLLELVFYALWATADVVILSGREWGHLLRIVPNVLYYAAFGWFVFLSAPKELRS